MERRIQGKPQALQAILDATNSLPEPKRQNALCAISQRFGGQISSVAEAQLATIGFQRPITPPVDIMPDNNNAQNQ